MSCNTLYHRSNDGVLDKTYHFHSSRKAFMLTNDFQNVCTLRHRRNQHRKDRELLLKGAKPEIKRLHSTKGVVDSHLNRTPPLRSQRPKRTRGVLFSFYCY